MILRGRRILADQMEFLLASVPRTTAACIDAQEPFTTYAMDSLTLAELSFAIEEELHARVPDAQMQQVQTLAQLADVLDSLREPQRA
jgi:acyl carrier protein